MFGIAAGEGGFDFRILDGPETFHVLRDLHRAVVRDEYVHENRNPAAGDTDGGGHVVDVLYARAAFWRLSGHVVDFHAAAFRQRDLGGSHRFDELDVVLRQQMARGVQAVFRLDGAIGRLAIAENAEDFQKVVGIILRQRMFGERLRRPADPRDPFFDVFVPIGQL